MRLGDFGFFLFLIVVFVSLRFGDSINQAIVGCQ